MPNITFRKWRLGLLIATAQAMFVAGATSLVGGDWKVALAAFCSAVGPLWTNYLKQHPIEEIEEK
jgi:hypothetical protein